jgi:hypothetical protein
MTAASGKILSKERRGENDMDVFQSCLGHLDISQSLSLRSRALDLPLPD